MVVRGYDQCAVIEPRIILISRIFLLQVLWMYIYIQQGWYWKILYFVMASEFFHTLQEKCNRSQGKKTCDSYCVFAVDAAYTANVWNSPCRKYFLLIWLENKYDLAVWGCLFYENKFILAVLSLAYETCPCFAISATLAMVTVHIYDDKAAHQHEMTRIHLNSYLDISLHVNWL